MGMLRAMMRQGGQPLQPQAMQPGGQMLPEATIAALPESTRRMAAMDQTQQGALPPMPQQPAPLAQSTEPWRQFGGPEFGPFIAAAFPGLQQQVLSGLAQYPQKKKTHTLGGGNR